MNSDDRAFINLAEQVALNMELFRIEEIENSLEEMIAKTRSFIRDDTAKLDILNSLPLEELDERSHFPANRQNLRHSLVTLLVDNQLRLGALQALLFEVQATKAVLPK